MQQSLAADLRRDGETTIVLLVLDGLGGLELFPGGGTELEVAHTPNLDRLAGEGICGLHESVACGITPGSGPAHLALFGYDPIEHQIGRGVLAALGTGFDLEDGDVAARGNFCTVDDDGNVVDRRAGRLDTETSRRLCERLAGIDLEGAELFIQTVKDYRFLLVLRGDSLSSEISDTDPQTTGTAPLQPTASDERAERTAALVDRFIARARELLADEDRANMVLLRGFSSRPVLRKLPEIYGIRAAAAATYPMYRGAAALVGMDVLDCGDDFDGELDALAESWDDYDFFFLHFKPTDSAGEDGDFARKVSLIESLDASLPRLMDLGPDVLIVTGDHSTPSRLRSHSWHPVPVLLWSNTCRRDAVESFGETACLQGGLGARFDSTQLMPLAFAHALRFAKFGA